MSNSYELLVRAATLTTLVSFVFAACQPSQEEQAGASVAETVTPTPTAPPPTETRTPTPAPTSIPSPTPFQGDFETYYPHDENEVWWYFYSLDGELIRPSSFSFTGTESLDDGTKVYLVENVENVFRQVDYQEISGQAVLLHRYQMFPKNRESDDIEYDPPIPFLRFPLEVGKSWTYQSDTYSVAALEAVSVPFGDFENCFVVERTRNDVIDFRSWYCPEVGRVLFEHASDIGRARLELIAMTNARVVIDEIQQRGDICEYRFRLRGFDEMEPVTFVVNLPGGEAVTQGEGIPVRDSFVFNYPIYSEDPTGLWTWQLSGTDHFAIYPFIWNGECG